MDWLKLKTNATKLFQKYKFVILIVMIGIVLMTLPETKSTSEETQEDISAETSYDSEERLKSILQQVRGAGRVEVMLTVASGEETIYQTDTDKSYDQNSQSDHQDTVIVTGSDRTETGLVTRIDPPVYLGAIVVCDGADDPTVRLQMVEAVSKATGLGADKISVLKMK